MTGQEIQEIIKEIKEFDEWMKSSAGCGCDSSIQDLIDDNGDIYEVIVTIGMTNGKEIELHNHCFESFIKQDYKGDTVYIQDNLIWAEYIDYESGDSYRQARIAPSSICYVDARTVDLNWEALYKQHMATRDIHEEGAEDELPSAEDIIEKQKVDLSYLNEVAKMKLAELVFFPYEGGIWPHVPTYDLIPHQPNHNEKALGLLPDNQPETMAAKYWEVFGND